LRLPAIPSPASSGDTHKLLKTHHDVTIKIPKML
jgi:hypothetical protein